MTAQESRELPAHYSRRFWLFAAQAALPQPPCPAGPPDRSIWPVPGGPAQTRERDRESDRKSTRLNSSHLGISYAVFCLKKKKRGSIPSAWRCWTCPTAATRTSGGPKARVLFFLMIRRPPGFTPFPHPAALPI